MNADVLRLAAASIRDGVECEIPDHHVLRELAVADLLDGVAWNHDNNWGGVTCCHVDDPCRTMHDALVVARMHLGEELA